MKKLFNNKRIFTDGSFHDETGKAGFSYVIESRDLKRRDHKCSGDHEIIGTETRRGSLYAELAAAALALERTESPKITIFTDHSSVDKFINATNQGKQALIDAAPEAIIKAVFERLRSAIEKHEHVNSQKISEKHLKGYQNQRMAIMAHSRSTLLSGVKQTKRAPLRDEDEEKRRRTISKGMDEHDSSGSMDIIEPEGNEKPDNLITITPPTSKGPKCF